ncbi:MAG: ABC transporter ATP-binding protein [Anaerolineae bacterium]|nr:ABC transporter ATP-binding protein [Anaerolineae bacterium]
MKLRDAAFSNSSSEDVFALKLQGVSKSYGNVRANRNINLSVRKDEIHAIVGENGAGKSTLMKIIYGTVEPDSGRLEVWGKPVQIRSSLDAIRLGIGMVFQHFTLAPNLTVAENVVLGAEPSRFGWLQAKTIEDVVNSLGSSFGFHVPTKALVRDLSVSQQQRVEILKTLYRRAKLLILDEPTAVLTPQETESLFDIIRKLRAEGHTIIFISHKLLEVKAIADRITVLRQGENVTTVDAENVTPADIANLMVGRSVLSKVTRSSSKPKEKVCEIKDLTVLSDAKNEVVKKISLTIHEGEILGLAGVEGNGQSQLIECIFGLRSPKSGRILLKNCDITSYSVSQRRRLGIAFIPPDRRTSGVAEQAKIFEVLLADRMSSPPFRKRMFLDQFQIGLKAKELIKEFGIKTSSPNSPVGSLSGGNIQKVVLAREISSNPKLLIAAEPTRGVDVAAAEFAHNRLLDALKQGLGILLLTSDLDELVLLANRIAVIYKGQIVAIEKNRPGLDLKQIGRYMMGVDRQDASLLAQQGFESL